MFLIIIVFDELSCLTGVLSCPVQQNFQFRFYSVLMNQKHFLSNYETHVVKIHGYLIFQIYLPTSYLKLTNVPPCKHNIKR